MVCGCMRLIIYVHRLVQHSKYNVLIVGLLEFEAAGLDGQLRIKGVSTGFYITMTPKGRIVGQPDKEQAGTIWVGIRQRQYFVICTENMKYYFFRLKLEWV